MDFLFFFKPNSYSQKIRIILFAFLLLPVIVFSQEEKYTQIYDSQAFLRKGIESYQSQNFEQALREYEKILPSDSDYLKAQYEKILTLFALKNEEELKSLLEHLHTTGQMNDFPELFLLYGSHLSDNEKFEESEKIFLEAEKLLPKSSVLLYNMGVLYIRMEDNQKAIDCFKKALTYNPNHSSSHYILGILAYDSGRIVEGSLAMLGYLTISPTGQFATEAVLKLNTKMGQDFLEKKNFVFSEKGDDFSELDLILRNQLPLNSKYKVKTSIDDVVTRQVQAIIEYGATHKVEDGFFENTYIPFLADIENKKYTEPFIYYTLVSFEDKLGKKLTTHKKKIIDFSEKYIISVNMWEVFGNRKLEHFGVVQDVVVYLENGFPNLIGKTVNGKIQGKFEYVNKHGQRLAELNYKDDELEGLQTYYYLSGKKSNYLNFEKGQKAGEFKEYYANGNIQTGGIYKNGEVDGKYVFYYPNGGKQCERTFKDGKITQTSICYYPNGQLKSEANYSESKLNGKFIEYNEVGDIIQSFTYKDDLLEGEGIVYLDGKKIKSKGIYAKGLNQGSYFEYYENGKLYREAVFENGKIKMSKEYYPNESLVSESFYDDKEQLDKHVYYDESGKKYFEERYKSGKTKVGYQYSDGNDQPKEVSMKKDLYEMRDLNGTLRISGYFKKGMMDGFWNYYKSNGRMNYKQNFVNDKVSGMRYDYDKTEKISGIYNQAEGGNFNGLYEGFRNEKLSVQMYFSDGQRNGPYQYFYKNGNVSSEGYYVDGKTYLKAYTYFQNGKLLRSSEYADNQLTKLKYFNEDEAYELDYANKSQKVKITESNGMVFTDVDYKNGVRNGKIVSKTKTGELISDADYINGVSHGKYEYYHPTGKIAMQINYYSGKENGTNKYYDLNGKLRLSTEYIFGKEFGKTTRYYQDGQKMYEYTSLNEKTDGEQIFYNLEGKPVAVIGYAMETVQYYKVLDKSGNLGELQKIKPTSDHQIISSYPDGKLAFKITLTKGLFDKSLEIYSENGQSNYISGFSEGRLHGKRIEYYKNGKICKSDNFEYSDYQGIQEYFSEDGIMIISAEYNFDEFHGDVKVFENGVMVKYKVYDSNELVEIKK